MTFDLAKTLAAPLADEGAFMQFRTATGASAVNDAKERVGVYLRARNSQAGLAQVRANGNRRISAASRGNAQMTVESNEADMTELLVVCTVKFVGFTEMDGVPFDPVSPEAARRFWSDDRFRRERERAEDFISAEANFTKS
jgi:hypothetical protein